jgi:hypothetical protein
MEKYGICTMLLMECGLGPDRDEPSRFGLIRPGPHLVRQVG